MFGALAIAMRQQLRGMGNVVAFSAAGLGVSLVLFSASRWFWLSFVLLVFCGFSMMMQFTATNTLIQAMVPEQLRGRVMSLYAMMFLGMSPLGSLRRRQAGRSHRRADDGRDRRLRQLPRRTGLCAQVALHARPGARPHRRARHDGARATAGGISTVLVRQEQGGGISAGRWRASVKASLFTVQDTRRILIETGTRTIMRRRRELRAHTFGRRFPCRARRSSDLPDSSRGAIPPWR